MFDEAAEKLHHPRPCTATIVRQMRSKTTDFLHVVEQRIPHPTSACSDGPEQSQQDPIDTPAPRQRNVTAGSSTAHPTLLAMI